MILARGPAKEAGFTIIEVLVAATLLLVGMLGVVTMVNGANSAVASAREREAATNLAREIAEQARSIPYSQVDATTLTPKLQAMAGLASITPDPTWTIARRGSTFRVDATVCSVDDTRDGLGDHAEGGYCEASTDTTDPSPRDLKRITIDVTWDDRGKQRSVRQVALVSPGNGKDAPLITSLTATSPTFPDTTHPLVTSTSTTQVTFTVVGSATADRVIWSLDGVDQTPVAVATSDPKTWTFTLPIEGLSDGTYTIGARAVDLNDVEGTPHEIPLDLLRRVPGAPVVTGAGFNIVRQAGVEIEAVDLEWLANPERNVVGYRVYRPDGSLACPGDATTTDERLACVDTAPTAGTYRVVAVFRDVAGVLQDGDPAYAVPQTVGTGWGTFWLTPAPTSSTNCGTTTAKEMPDAFRFPDVATSTLIGSTQIRWCSTPAPEKTLVKASPTGAETTLVSAYFKNTSDKQSCNLRVAARINGAGTPFEATQNTIPARTTTAAPVTFAITTPEMTLAAGSRFVFDLSGTGGGCATTTVEYAGTSRRSYAQLGGGGGVRRPDPPTDVSITATSSGPRLTWVGPASSASVESYRIYRGGTDYTDRYDRTGDASTAYTDPKPMPGLEYWVTSVGRNLVESEPAGPVTTP